MRICFLGNFSTPHSSENDYLWTMRERLGFDVVTVQENTTTATQVLHEAVRSDVFFWVHTHGWDIPGMMGVLDTLRDLGVPSVAYHLDLYRGFDRWGAYETHPYFHVDHFFTVDKLHAEWFNTQTATAGHFLRPGVVERDCAIVEGDRPRDIIFVGSYKYHSAWPYRKTLIDWLRATYRERFELWGPHGKGVVRGLDLTLLYGESKIVIGDTFCPDFTYPHYTSDRAYEVLGRGGFLIHPYITGMDEELVDGEHLAYYPYQDFDALKTTIDRYLTDDAERERIRRAGHRKVSADCTYTNRLSELFDTLREESN